MKIRQVNNLSIEYTKKRMWEIVTPDGNHIGPFDTEYLAVSCAKEIKTYKKKKNKIKTNNIEKLCEAVNEKYGIKHGEIGSIEHYQDMSENSIVQIMNKSKGTKQLVFGNDNELRKYLKGILDGFIILDVTVKEMEV